jgi:intracellular sulfur oxidation DsrE/DsrF family protein
MQEKNCQKSGGESATGRCILMIVGTDRHLLSDTTNNVPMEAIMTRRRFLSVLFAIVALAGNTSLHAQDSTPILRIDVPTKLDKAHVVVDVGHLVLNGDMPFVLGDVNLLSDNLHEWNADGNIIMIFHGDAAQLVLADNSYDANRHVQTGNPYKKLMLELMAKGVHIELCGATAKGNHWGNSDLLPGVTVNLNAMVRITQLEQSGYTLIYQ